MKNHHNNPDFKGRADTERKSFIGLTLSDIHKSKWSFPVGIERLRKMAEVKVEKPVKIKFYDQFDGFDIDIDRMYEHLDYLINEKKVKKLPKAIDIYVNIGENSDKTYTEMLHKTYASLRIIDHLESLGVRTSVWVAMYTVKPNVNSDGYFEVCVKKHSDPVNLGALCTAISPWMCRYWGLLWLAGNFPTTKATMGHATRLPREELPKDCIVIDNGFCLSETTANNFIESIKIA